MITKTATKINIHASIFICSRGELAVAGLCPAREARLCRASLASAGRAAFSTERFRPAGLSGFARAGSTLRSQRPHLRAREHSDHSSWRQLDVQREDHTWSIITLCNIIVPAPPSHSIG